MRNFPSWEAFGKQIDAMAKEMHAAERAKITRLMGVRAQQIAEAAASGDLGGDPKFSGWPPRLETQVRTKPDGSSVLMPTKTGAGPWTVAQFGRNQGNAGGFAGPGINIRTGRTSRTKSGGLRKVRVRQAKRWNGRTQGKGTADTALVRMERELPKIAETMFRRAIQQHLDVD